jgi:hypothetical protein
MLRRFDLQQAQQLHERPGGQQEEGEGEGQKEKALIRVNSRASNVAPL